MIQVSNNNNSLLTIIVLTILNTNNLYTVKWYQIFLFGKMIFKQILLDPFEGL